MTPGAPGPVFGYRRAYTAGVVADLSVIVLIVACTAIAGCCALVTLSLWRGGR